MIPFLHNIKTIITTLITYGVRGNARADSPVLLRLWSRWGFLSLIIIVYLYRTIGYLHPFLTPDAENTYLPYAQKLLDHGFEFLLNRESIYVAPVSYIWPAIFGAKVLVIKYANIFCGLFMVLFVYGIGRRLHSHTAGLIAAFLFARSPLIIYWIPTVLSEPPFYLFTFMWMWSIGEIVAKKKWAIPIASIALSLSILSRSVWLYPSIIFLFIAMIWYLIKPSDRQLVLSFIITLILGLLLPIAVIIKNIILFDLPSITLGSGWALYLGTNIMTGGFEPPLIGLGYSSGYDSIVYNREHMLVAIEFLRDRTIFELIEWFMQKISWNLLFTSIDTSSKVAYWRAIELGMASIGIWWGIKRKSIFIMILGFALILHVFQTALVLYNVRYSTDNIELLLVPLAAVGFAVSFKLGILKDECLASSQRFNKRYSNITYGRVGALLSLILISMIYFKIRPIPKINIPESTHVSKLFEVSNLKPIHDASNLNKNNRLVAFEVNIPKQIKPSGANEALWNVEMSVLTEASGVCDSATISFIPEGKPRKNNVYRKFQLETNLGVHKYYIGTNYINNNLFPLSKGKLNLVFDCDPFVQMNINKVSLVSLNFTESYWKRISQ